MGVTATTTVTLGIFLNDHDFVIATNFVNSTTFRKDPSGNYFTVTGNISIIQSSDQASSCQTMYNAPFTASLGIDASESFSVLGDWTIYYQVLLQTWLHDTEYINNVNFVDFNFKAI